MSQTQFSHSAAQPQCSSATVQLSHSAAEPQCSSATEQLRHSAAEPQCSSATVQLSYSTITPFLDTVFIIVYTTFSLEPLVCTVHNITLSKCETRDAP